MAWWATMTWLWHCMRKTPTVSTARKAAYERNIETYQALPTSAVSLVKHKNKNMSYTAHIRQILLLDDEAHSRVYHCYAVTQVWISPILTDCGLSGLSYPRLCVCLSVCLSVRLACYGQTRKRSELVLDAKVTTEDSCFVLHGVQNGTSPPSESLR